MTKLFLKTVLLCTVMTFFTAGSGTAEMSCAQGIIPFPDSAGTCSEPGVAVSLENVEGSLLLLLALTKQAAPAIPGHPDSSKQHTYVDLFVGSGCPHCEEEKTFLNGLKQKYPSLVIREHEVWYDRENARLLTAMLQAYGHQTSGVPITFIGTRLFSGFSAQSRKEIENAISDCMAMLCPDPQNSYGSEMFPGRGVAGDYSKADTSITIPLIGNLDSKNTSLPVLTLIIAGMDSFNPCAFFVLLTLLGLLIHAQSRRKMFLIGGIFVLFSGAIYFVFMAAWLNLFLIMGHVAVITGVAGCVSIIIAGINIKDFFLFKRGLSLGIPDSAKPKLFERMRNLLRSSSLVSVIIGASALAVLANFYELLCTAGFPMLYTRILTLRNLSTATHYLYLLLYNAIYVIPLFMIVLGFTLTLGKRKLSEWQGRVLKLISGTMMLGLGGVLLVTPELLNSATVSFIILASALGVSLLVALVTRRLEG